MNIEAAPQEKTTRDKIPVVALRLFAEKGYEATSMREIAEQLNITKAALYYHFDSKEDIVRAVVSTMIDDVGDLVAWARTQPTGPHLNREILSRWIDIRQAQGLALFRFMVTNRRLLEDVKSEHQDIRSQMAELYELLTPPMATLDEQLRVRMALMSITMAGTAGMDIDASEDEIFAAARRIAFGLLPAGD